MEHDSDVQSIDTAVSHLYNLSVYDYDYELEDDADLSGSLECSTYQEFQLAFLLYSIVVLILYTIFQKRVKWNSKLPSKYFGLPIPINLVHETKDRWAYVAVFGGLSGTFVQLIFDGNLVSPQGFVDSIFRGFFLFLTMMFIPLLFFALIASVHGRIQVLTHAIGLVYVASTLAQQTLICIDCHKAACFITPRIDRVIQYVHIYGTIIPIMLCNALTGIYFLIRGAQAVISIITGKPFTSQSDISHHLGYVKRLLAREPITEPSDSPTKLKKLAILFGHFVYKNDPYFKYPIRLLCITSVIIVGLFVLTIQLLTFFITIVVFAESSTSAYEVNDNDVVQRLIKVAYAFAVIIPVVSYTITVTSFSRSVVAYRDHCKHIWRGDDSFMPNRKNKPATVLVRSTFYVGWQIGMVMWAWIFYVILMVLIVVTIVIVVMALVYVPEIRDWIVQRAILLASTAITGLIFTIAQGLIVRCLFANGKTLIVNNSRLFHIYTYFLLFYNALIGLGKAIRRICTSAVISLFFLPRLDRSLLIQGLDKLDKGYIAYLSAVRVDAAYNNPVMNVFVYLLSLEMTSYKSTGILDRFTIQSYYQDTVAITNNDVTLKHIRSKAKKMWHLVYTLVNNPNLMELRRKGMDYKTTATDLTTQEATKSSVFGIANDLAEKVNNDSENP